MIQEIKRHWAHGMADLMFWAWASAIAQEYYENERRYTRSRSHLACKEQILGSLVKHGHWPRYFGRNLSRNINGTKEYIITDILWTQTNWLNVGRK